MLWILLSHFYLIPTLTAVILAFDYGIRLVSDLPLANARLGSKSAKHYTIAVF